MPQYMLLIYSSEAEAKNISDAENQKIMQEFMQLAQDLGKSGKLKGGDPLEPTTMATTVRIRNGRTVVTDGPFAETKEQLAGNFIVEAKDLDEAISIAARIPSARFGSIEVRPVRKVSM